MSRSRRKVEIIQSSQPLITEYFSERKSRKRPSDLKDKDKLSICKIPKKIVALDSTLDSKKITETKSTNSSKLLISVLKKQTKLQVSVKKVSRKENNNPDFKVLLDSSNLDAQETISQSLNQINLPKERNKSQEVPISEKLVNKKELKESEVINVLDLEKNIQIPIPEKLQKDEIPVGEISKIVTRQTNRSVPIKKTKKVILKLPETTPATCEEANLPLPSSYTFLERIFTCIDSVAMMLYKQGRIITFTKLQPTLKNLSEEIITLDHLAQIKTIYPEAYFFKRRKIRVSDALREEYEVILEPNFEFDFKIEKPKESHLDVLLLRKEKFHTALLEWVKKEHEKFLKATSKSGSVIRKVRINCWHPNFDIEKCKPIEMSDLPVFRNNIITSPKEVLEKVMTCIKIKTNLTKVPETVESASKQGEKDENQDYYQRLPAIAKIVNSIFSSEKKNVLALNLLIQKLQYSYNIKLTIAELEKHIRFLCQFVPEWISLFNLGKVDRLKIDRKIPLQKVYKILEERNDNK